ncbi:DUF535 family protein [Helicobacter pametensis]|uniref:DUF535 family protein n=1 Tax=Helicobacter pametensis TaxID=95149 RepID=UPI00047F072D|nr:DUF535 family protein [Helicobacter pametensis]
MTYRWPKVSELYGGVGQRRGFDSKLYFLRQALRFWARSFLARKQISQFVAQINQDHRLIEFFLVNRGGDYRIVCIDFANQNLSRAQRMELIWENCLILLKFDHSIFQKLIQHQEILLFSHEDVQIVFKVNGTFEEGFLAVEMQCNHQRIYGASFCIDPSKQALIIASIQGLIQGDEAREKIKIMTKKCYGLRPQICLIEAMRYMMAFFDCRILWGISQSAQVRFSSRKRGYFADYDQLWDEVGGVRCGDYFDITQTQRKELDEIPSQKRSMYKKRFALLDEMRDAIERKFDAMR